MIKHLAVVMDGNRRWARKNKIDILFGHSKGGVNAAKTTVKFCLEKGIKYLSLYAFSLENLKRSEIEKKFLFDLLIKENSQTAEEFIKNNIQVRFIGDKSLFPELVRKSCDLLEEKTKACSGLFLNILFCYGARQEIFSAAKTLFEKIKLGLLEQKDVCQKDLENCFWTSGIPEPDLIIRTGGASRLSNFLLYQSAYSELCFLDCLWPEITYQHLEKALLQFQMTQRNFGI